MDGPVHVDLSVGASEGGSLSHRQILAILSGLMLAMVMGAIDQTIVATALPTIVGDLGGLNHLSWVITAYLLASTVSTPIYGKLGDRFGRKRLLQSAIVVFVGGSALSGVAQTMFQLVAFRAVQGLGAGGLMVLAMSVIAEVVPPRELGRYQGYFGVTFGGSTILGPLIGGFITDNLSWRWIFYVNLPLGALALTVIAITTPGRKAEGTPRIDYLGAALMITAITGLVLITTWGGREYAWGSSMILVLAAVSVIALAVFLVVERRAPEPLLPLLLFRNRTFTTSAGISLVQGLAMMGSMAFIPLFLQIVVGVSATKSGLNTAPMMGGVLVASALSGQLITRTGRYRIFPILGMALSLVAAILFSTMGTGTGRFTVAGYMVVLGAGMSLVMQVTIVATQNAVPPTQLGVATASVQFFRSIGGSVGLALFGAVFNSRLALELKHAFGSQGAGAGAGGGGAGGGAFAGGDGPSRPTSTAGGGPRPLRLRLRPRHPPPVPDQCAPAGAGPAPGAVPPGAAAASGRAQPGRTARGRGPQRRRARQQRGAAGLLPGSRRCS